MTTNTLTKKLMARLLKRADNHRGNLFLLILGAGIFFLGTGLIVWVNQFLPSSVEQELIALAGLVMCIVGSGIAFLGYLGLSLLRLIKFFTDKP